MQAPTNLVFKNNFYSLVSGHNALVWTALGNQSLANLKKHLFCLFSSMSTTVFDVLELEGYSYAPKEQIILDHYKLTTKPAKIFPFGLTFGGPNFGEYIQIQFFRGESFSVDICNSLNSIIAWYEQLGFKITEILTNRELAATADNLVLNTQIDENPFFIELELVLNTSTFRILVMTEEVIGTSLEYMDTNGDRLPVKAVRFKYPRLDILLLQLLIQLEFKLPAIVVPYSSVVLSVSEKYEGLANFVALKLGAHADCSSDPVSKKIRNWKALGVTNIFVVGEKDLQQIYSTGKVILQNNTLDGKLIPVEVDFLK